MSSSRKTTRKATRKTTKTTKTEAKPEDVSVYQAPQATLTPEQQKLQVLIQNLINEATSLVIKVATVDCNHKDNCPVYKVGREIAKIIDEIMSLRK